MGNAGFCPSAVVRRPNKAGFFAGSRLIHRKQSRLKALLAFVKASGLSCLLPVGTYAVLLELKLKRLTSQTFQNPLTKECTLNNIRDPIRI